VPQLRDVKAEEIEIESSTETINIENQDKSEAPNVNMNITSRKNEILNMTSKKEEAPIKKDYALLEEKETTRRLVGNKVPKKPENPSTWV